MQNTLTYNAIFPTQTKKIPVFSFVANVNDIKKFARIDRASRNESGLLRGFQRPQIANHIKEIKNYLLKDGAMLPNPIVVAFTDGIKVSGGSNGLRKIAIDISKEPKGWIVDGQQRFSALLELSEKRFEVFISAFVCKNEEELHRQFILINNTRPLPKSLIYELLPRVKGLPDRYSSRTTAASLVEILNYNEESCLKGLIRQQTNPSGVIVDTSIQKVVMNSLSDGALRLIYNDPDFEDKAFRLLNNFFKAVIKNFPKAWEGHKPRTSRLVHGAGIVSMGFLMEAMFTMSGARTVDEFSEGIAIIKDKTAWTEGQWFFSQDDVRKWNSIQNVPRDIRQLSQYLISQYKHFLRSAKQCV